MGIERGSVARESGCSPIVLRRRLSELEAIRNPAWARETTEIRHLITMTLVGTWHARSKADREILEKIAGTSYREVESNMAGLLLHDDDCPVWQVDHYCGVVVQDRRSVRPCPSMTRTHLTDFLELAEYVLSEWDPSLELPLDKRWMANIYGTEREHSRRAADRSLRDTSPAGDSWEFLIPDTRHRRRGSGVRSGPTTAYPVYERKSTVA